MISDEVARDGLAAVAVAATMLIEDVLDQLVVTRASTGQGATANIVVAPLLKRLGADLSALAAAATVFARPEEDDVVPGAG